MASVLVTGGAGFIGSNLCRKLVEKGDTVTCFDNLSTGLMDNISALKKEKNFKFVKGDANKKDIEAVFKKHSFDYVFHHAAVVGVKRTEEKPLDVLGDINGIRNILELSRKHDIKKVIYASSSEIYGQPVEIPEREDGIINPKIPYASVKLLGEKLLQGYYSKYGLRTTSLRLFNAYGPYQNSSPYGFVVSIFIRQTLSNKNPTVFGDGKQTRDFVFVEDNINATIKALESKEADGRVINIGSGKETTVLKLAETVIRLCNKKNLKPEFLPERKDEILRRCADIRRMKELLGYETKFSLEQGIKKTIDFYKGRAG